MEAHKIKKILKERYLNGDNVFVPEFTFGNYRIDAAIFNVKTRWIRGFEIKVSRSDYLSDSKWHMYTSFLSSLAIVCPGGLIKKDEVPKPFGLLYVNEEKSQWSDHVIHTLHWEKRPKNFQKRDSFAWFNIYTRAMELEFKRLARENFRMEDKQ